VSPFLTLLSGGFCAKFFGRIWHNFCCSFWGARLHIFLQNFGGIFEKPLDGAGGLCYFIKVGGDSEFRVTGR
jgi:hypothetical protein